jgi:hypothetical protein
MAVRAFMRTFVKTFVRRRLPRTLSTGRAWISCAICAMERASSAS